MIDLRLWRIVLLAVPLALVVAMFSLREAPQPLQPQLPPDAFEGDAAAALAKELAAQAPEPRPGSEQDAALADEVLARLREINSMEVSEQRFGGSYDDEEIELRNLIGVLPGPSERQVALIAGRDTLEGSGAASTIASTAALLELAGGFAGSTHEKTLVFASTDGASIGALGARRFAEDYSDAALLDTVIVLSQPAAADPAAPLVIPWSTGERSTSAGFAQTASSMVSDEVDRPAGDESPLSDLFRLAIPSAIGEQGPLVEAGFDSVRLSSSGELPLPAGQDQPGEISADTLGRFGRSALSLMLAVDSAREPPEHGPSTYIGLAGNLMPGWTLAMLGLALLLPLGAVGFGGVAASAHSPAEGVRALGWVALRAAPFLLGFGLLVAAGLVGLVPSPEFPFLPSAEELGLSGRIAVALSLLLFAAAAFLLRPLLAPPSSLATLAPAAAISLAALACFGIWLLNPYLALLVALGLQLWVPVAARLTPGRLAAAGLVLAGLIPALAAIAALAGRFDAGIGVIWDLLFMFTGGQLPYALALLACVLAGTGLALIAVNGTPAEPGSEQFSLRAMVARGRVLEQRRARKRAAQAGEQAQPGEAEADGEAAEAERAERSVEPGEAEAGADERPGDGLPQEEPSRDPRLWSKPPASICSPSRPSTAAPSPSSTRPISVRPGLSASSALA